MKKPTLLLWLVLLLATSCAPLYRSTVVNTPLFQEKGSFQGSVHTGTHGTDAQGAYAITDNVFVLANGSWFDSTDENDTTDETYSKHSLAELGAGYVHTFADQGVVEVAGGYGNGKVKGYNSYWSDDADIVTGRMHKLFFQPSIGATGDVGDVAFSPRLVWLDHYNIESNTDNKALANSKSFDAFFEPSITGRVGYKFVKFQAQLGLSLPVSSSSVPYDYQPLLFSIGVHFDLERNYLKGEEE